MPIIIGITGQMHHGKDEIAKILKRRFKYVHISFAMFLKEACKNIFSFTDEQLHGESKDSLDERWGVAPRRVLQVVGTELFRERFKELLPEALQPNESIWVKSMRLYLKTLHPSTCVVISDVRFEDEAALITKEGGEIWKVVRASIEGTHTHKSETELANIVPNKVIQNDGTLLQLEQTVVRLLDHTSFVMPKREHRKGIKLDFMPTSIFDLQQGEPVTQGTRIFTNKKAKVEEHQAQPSEETH
jgi:hypothetical protein